MNVQFGAVIPVPHPVEEYTPQEFRAFVSWDYPGHGSELFQRQSLSDLVRTRRVFSIEVETYELQRSWRQQSRLSSIRLTVTFKVERFYYCSLFVSCVISAKKSTTSESSNY